MSSNLVKGTAILTVGLFLSKALGLLYLIPLYAIVGEENIGLYQYAYIPYNIALAIAISGAPLAISKYVSKYNALGDYATGRKLLKSGMLVMAITGIVSFFTLYLLAEPIAQLVRRDEEQIFTVDDIAGVIRWVSYALICCTAYEYCSWFSARISEIGTYSCLATCRTDCQNHRCSCGRIHCRQCLGWIAKNSSQFCGICSIYRSTCRSCSPI